MLVRSIVSARPPHYPATFESISRPPRHTCGDGLGQFPLKLPRRAAGSAPAKVDEPLKSRVRFPPIGELVFPWPSATLPHSRLSCNLPGVPTTRPNARRGSSVASRRGRERSPLVPLHAQGWV